MWFAGQDSVSQDKLDRLEKVILRATKTRSFTSAALTCRIL